MAFVLALHSTVLKKPASSWLIPWEGRNGVELACNVLTCLGPARGTGLS